MHQGIATQNSLFGNRIDSLFPLKQRENKRKEEEFGSIKTVLTQSLRSNNRELIQWALHQEVMNNEITS